jgi:hypothetical protein
MKRSERRSSNTNKSFFFIPPPLSFIILSLLFKISFIHLIFIQYFSPFLSLPLSFRYIHSTSAQLTLFLLSTFCNLFSLLPSNTCFLSSFLHLNLPIIFLSLALSLPRFLPFFLACLCLCPLHSALHSFIFLLLSTFPLLHWHTSSSGSTSLSFFSLFFFFSLKYSVSILHSSLPSILSSNFAALFPAFTLSLFLLQSSLTM